MKFRRTFGLPLLTRELIEQSRRPKTYLLRTAYAIVLFAIVFLQFQEVLTRLERNPLSVLGTGSQMFAWLLWTGMLGIYLVLPTLMCSAITSERENNTLSLLLITRLSPSTILLEKLFGGLVPMFSLLLLCMPLAAFFYSLGGVSPGQLWGGLWMLFLACLQVGVFSLMFSVKSRTSVSALLRTYVWGALILCLFWMCFTGLLVSVGYGPVGGGGEVIVVLSFLYLLPTVICWAIALAALKAEFAGETDSSREHANTSRSSPDTITHGETRRDLGAIRDRPVLWRLWRRQSRHRRLVIGIIEAMLALYLLLSRESVVLLYFVTWTFALPMVVVTAATPMMSERARQTRDVLLATAITGRALIGQQMAYLYRVCAVVAIPFATVILGGLYWSNSSGMLWYLKPVQVRSVDLPPFLLCWALAVVVYLPLAAWVSFLIGLKSRTAARAIAITLGLCIASIFAAGLFDVRTWAWLPIGPILPAFVLFQNARGLVDYGDLLLNFGYYTVVLLLVRRYCLRHADRLLGRAGEPEGAFARIRSRWLPAGKMVRT